MIRGRVTRKYLEKQFAARSRKLEILKQRLKEQEVLACLGLAVSKVAHEIANPLNGMSTCVQLLGRQTREQGLDRDRILDAINHLYSEIARLETLLQELRLLGRPLKLNVVPVSLDTLIAEILQKSFTPNGAGAIEIEMVFPEELPPVMADPEKLRQVLLNLTKNAIEAMPEGGRLTLRAYQSKNNVCVEIQDTGVGIPKEVRVFTCFATSKPGGWGLGLSIAQQIMSAHHGNIDYTSKPGHGTTFKIMLPAAVSFPSHQGRSSSKAVTPFLSV